MDEDEDDFYYSNWRRIKSVREDRKYNGRTCTRLYASHRNQLNTRNTMRYAIINQPPYDATLELGKLKKRLVDLDLGIDMIYRNQVDYSLNRRKRWLLPDQIESRFDEDTFDDFQLEIMIKDNFLPHYKFVHTVDSFITSDGDRFRNRRKLNVNSLMVVKNNVRTRKRVRKERNRARVVDLAEYAHKRKLYKHGRRDRHSGIKRRNEKYPTVQPEQQEPPRKPGISFSFDLVQKTLPVKRWPHEGYRHLPINGPNYGKRFFKTYGYWGRQINRMIRWFKRQNKPNVQRGIMDELNESKHDDHRPLIENEPAQENVSNLKLGDFIPASSSRIKVQRKLPQKPAVQTSKRLIYIERDLNPTPSVTIPQPMSYVETYELVDYSVQIENEASFSGSIIDLIEAKTFVYVCDECSPRRVVIELSPQSCVTFTYGSNLANGKFSFKLNSPGSITLSRNCYSNIGQLIREMEIPRSEVESRFKQPTGTTTLVGIYAYTSYNTLIEETKQLLSRPRSFNPTESGEVAVECGICYECEDVITLNECQHSACYKCWYNYLKIRILNMGTSERGQLECPFDRCTNRIWLQFVQSIVPMRLVQTYVDIQASRMSGIKYRFCPNRPCDNLIRLDVPADGDVLVCSCGYRMCKRCHNRAHYPASCDNMSTYMKRIKLIEDKYRQTDPNTIYKSEGKKCPNCHVYFEKNGGCNIVFCRCQVNFCWECLKILSRDMFGHDKCAKNAKPIKIDPSYFLETNRRSDYELRMGTLLNEKHKKNLNSFRLKLGLKCERFVQKLIASSKTQSNDDKLDVIQMRTNLNTAAAYLKEIYHLNEFFTLYLFLNRKNRLFAGADSTYYSFKSNIRLSFYKSLDFEKNLEEFFNDPNENPMQDYVKLTQLLRNIKSFVNNLKHFLSQINFN